jgi:steroid 5-alpha reductase family enzyme
MRAILVLCLAAPAAGFVAPAKRCHHTAQSTPFRSSTPTAALPGIPALAAACVGPACLGYWKNGYAVSYAYGGAMAAGAYLILPHANDLALAHAAAFIFYGVRLCLFLLYREIALSESVHQMVHRPADLAVRLKRTPVVLGCAFLYICMLAPLRVTASVGAPATGPAAVAVKLMFTGFGVAALGDLVKSMVKARNSYGFEALARNELVTAFPFNLLRHPNYTGEFVGWTASFAAAVLAAAASPGGIRSSLGWLLTSAVGTAGIQYVLAEAAGGLEKKQRAKYAAKPEYAAWIANSWAGPVLDKE